MPHAEIQFREQVHRDDRGLAEARAAGARPYAVGGVIGAAVASAIAAALWLAGPAPVVPQRRVVRFTLEIPVGRALQSFALAPDGSRLAYVATEGGQPRIYVRGLDQGNDVALAGTEGAIAPFFSPDSQWIAFFAAGRLRKVAAQGGEVLSIAEAPFSGVDTAREPTGIWAGETIIFSVGGRGLMRVPASGGSTAKLLY